MEIDIPSEVTRILEQNGVDSAFDGTSELREVIPDRAVRATVFLQLRLRLSEVCDFDFDAPELERKTVLELIRYLRGSMDRRMVSQCCSED